METTFAPRLSQRLLTAGLAGCGLIFIILLIALPVLSVAKSATELVDGHGLDWVRLAVAAAILVVGIVSMRQARPLCFEVCLSAARRISLSGVRLSASLTLAGRSLELQAVPLRWQHRAVNRGLLVEVTGRRPFLALLPESLMSPTAKECLRATFCTHGAAAAGGAGAGQCPSGSAADPPDAA